MITDLKDITMTGRFCYVFMCIERYLKSRYPDVDWKPISRRMWQWTNRYWDESREKYSEIVPEYILRFPGFEETNEKEYDGKLERGAYEEITACYKGITNGSEDDEINRVIKVPIEMGSLCEGAAFHSAEPLVQECIDELEGILLGHSIELPSADALAPFYFDRNTKASSNEINPCWGAFEDTEYLSIIL